MADQLTDLLHVGGIAHEAEGNPIDTLLETEHQILSVLVGESANRQLDVREVDPLLLDRTPPTVTLQCRV